MQRPLASAALDHPALRLEKVAKRFGDRLLFSGVDFRLERHEQVALIGESGSGKSTLLNLIAGLDHMSEGNIYIAGHALISSSETDIETDTSAQLRREHIGFVFQAFHLMPQLDSVQNVALPLLLKGESALSAQQKSKVLLERLGLSTRLKARPSELSGGEQQRVALARALVHQPSLVLADEPTGNLDSQTASMALKLLLELCKDQGSSLLMVTHSEEAASMCQRTFRLKEGRLEALHDTGSLRTSSSNNKSTDDSSLNTDLGNRFSE